MKGLLLVILILCTVSLFGLGSNEVYVLEGEVIGKEYRKGDIWKSERHYIVVLTPEREIKRWARYYLYCLVDIGDYIEWRVNGNYYTLFLSINGKDETEWFRELDS